MYNSLLLLLEDAACYSGDEENWQAPSSSPPHTTSSFQSSDSAGAIAQRPPHHTYWQHWSVNVRDFGALTETLHNEFAMHPLFINQEQLANQFEHQVLVTPNFMEARPLVIILHDPPESITSPNPHTGKIKLQNTWVTYIKEAVDNNFAVIDVNLPKDTNTDSDTHEHQSSGRTGYRIQEAKELLTYLWDNYIALGDTTQIFLIGTNIGHGAITNFIEANEDRAQRMITKAVSFVGDIPILPCKSQTNDYLSTWYYCSSMVFVAQDHAYFSNGNAEKPKSCSGAITRSDSGSISDMLLEAKQIVFECLLADTREWRSKSLSEDGRDTS